MAALSISGLGVKISSLAFKNLNWLRLLSIQSVTEKTKCWGEWPAHFPNEVTAPVWFHRLQSDEVLRFIQEVSQSWEGPCAMLSPAGTRGDKLLSLHLGRSSTYSTISAAISANGCVALFQIDQLHCAGHGLSHLLNQLWAITFSNRDLFCRPPVWLGGTDESLGWSDEAVSWECHRWQWCSSLRILSYELVLNSWVLLSTLFCN